MASDDKETASLSQELPELLRAQEVARFLDLVGFSKDDLQKEPLRHGDLMTRLHTKDSRSDFPFRNSNSTILSALVQLGVVRLGAARAIISLLDSTTQYILAEAVPTWLADPDATSPSDNIGIYVGCGNLPRKDGFCELVLDPSNVPEDGVVTPSGTVVLTNLRSCRRTSEKRFLEHNGIYKFYAGHPIRSRTGITIGAYCIFGIQQKSGLSNEEEQILRDLTETVSNQLEALHAQSEAQRRSELINGLHLFNDGLNIPTDLAYWSDADIEVQEQCFKTENYAEPTRSHTSLPSFFQTLHPPSATPIETMQEFVDLERLDDLEDHHLSDNADDLWRRALPEGTLRIFTRAAHILHFSAGYDGVVFLHMASHQTLPLRSDAHPATAHIVRSISQENMDQDGVCKVLGSAFAREHRAGAAKNLKKFTMKDLNLVIGQRRPQAKTISIVTARNKTHPDATALQFELEMREGSTQIPVAISQNAEHVEEDEQYAEYQSPRTRALRKLAPRARNFIALPLWDHERQRWFATCICWTSKSKMSSDLAEDLGYLRTLGNSVMASLSRLDAKTSLRSKQTFVSSISHELRSPLHGIMGSLDLLHYTGVTRSQQVYVDAIASCSQTLLDTLDHVINFAEINNTNPNVNSQISSGKLELSDKKSYSECPAIVNVAELAEEVAEALWYGSRQWHNNNNGGISNNNNNDDDDDDDDNNHDIDKTDNNYDNDNNNNNNNANNNNKHFLKPELKSQHVEQRPTLKRGSSYSTSGRSSPVALSLCVKYRLNWCVHSQSKALKRLLTIVIGNALKFTDNGYVLLELAIDQNKGEAAFLKIIVRDTGCGISSEYLDNYLFRPFSQEDSLTSGAGLGLSIAKNVVDGMNGSMTISSKVSQGTTVNISIPVKMCPPDSVRPSFDWLAMIRARTMKQKVALFSGRMTKPERKAIDDDRNEPQMQDVAHMLEDWLLCEVAVSSIEDVKQANIIILLTPNFELLEEIQRTVRSPRSVFLLIVAHDLVELSALRPDVRIKSSQMNIEFLVHPIGPRKLGTTLHRLLEGPTFPRSDSFTAPNVMASSVADSTRNDHKSFVVNMEKSSRTTVSILLAPPSPDNKGILIVDDNPINLRLLSTFLKKKSVPFFEAKNGKEAIDVYFMQHASIFLVLMDISMPVMTGTAATQQIRSFEASHAIDHTPVIAVTGLVNDSARADAEAAGMDDYLTKPLSLRAIAEIVQKYSTSKEGLDE